ncbi:MAG TPA: ferrous iron transport protein A [Bacillota bacterium]|nr:ferrous iron transport protein A [Bacillota bacterium]
MTLDKVKKGQKIRLCSIPGEEVRAQAIRFGLSEGEIVTCCEIMPAGPIVVQRSRQEIAIGRGLARDIQVELVS